MQALSSIPKPALVGRPIAWAFVILAVFFSLNLHGQPAFIAHSLPGHVPPAISRLHLQPLGDLPTTNTLHLTISLPLSNEAALDKLLQQIYDPASTNYHQYLTPEQFTERFAPSQQDYDAVVRFAQSKGLTVTKTYSSRRLVDVSGSADTVEKAFHVALHVYQHPTENRTFFAPDTDPIINQNVSISRIDGLDNFRIPHPAISKIRPLSHSASAIRPGLGSGPDQTYMGTDFRAAYVPGVTLNGAGQTVGLLELDGYYPTDIQTYEVDAKLPNTVLTNITVDFSGPTGNVTNMTEVSLDIEMAISMATNLSAVAVFEENNGGNIVDILEAMAANSSIKQISSSWLIGDSSSYDTEYKAMAAEGQSFFQASGDDGAFFTKNESDEEYADDTNITLVGGTTMYTATPGGAWSSETAWNWYITDPSIAPGGTGGGTNFNGYVIPTWQQGISMTNNQGSTTLRNVPDVALTADNIFVLVTNTDYFVGGTSCAAPLWAAFTALVNQQAVAAGRSTVGFLNPAIYAIGKSTSYTNDFHDITTGNNTNYDVGNKYFAAAGYDLCTGWGTPNGQGLINALAPPDTLIINPASGFNAIGVPGGLFNPNSETCTLTNTSSALLTWSLINTSSWLSATSSGGTISADGTGSVTIYLNSATNLLAIGSYNATLIFSNQVSHVAQNFYFTLQVEEPLVALPTAGLMAAGPIGGPLTPASQNFTLTNMSFVSLNWQAVAPAWLTISPTNGTLAGSATATVSVSLNSSASNLVAAVYNNPVVFTDETSGQITDGLFILSVGQSIVLNGGFETGDFTDWTFVGNSADTFVDFDGSASGIPPHGGSYAAVFGDTSVDTISQTLTTIANQSYLLSFWFFSPNVSEATGGTITGYMPNKLTATWNGTNVFSQSNISQFNVWSNLSYIVTAPGTSTVLKFGGEDKVWFLGLDDVSVTPIPLPNVTGVSQISKNDFSMTLNSLPGLMYKVQYSTNLLSTNWFNLGTNTATGTTLTITNPIGTNTYLFYRVLRLP